MSFARSIADGDFAAGRAWCQALLAASPDDPRALLGLSALAVRDRQPERARALLHAATRASPVRHASRTPGRPLVLRPRAIDAIVHRIIRGRDGQWKTKWKGGHFSLTHLLYDDACDLSMASLIGGDTAPLDAAPLPDLFLNTVACADSARVTLHALADWLDRHPHLPVVNHPRAVLATTRDGNARRLGALADTVFPRTLRLRTAATPAATLATLDLRPPFILRATGRQTGRDMHRCLDEAAALAALEKLGPDRDCYAIAYVDARAPDGLSRKARAFFIDGRVHPVAWLASDHWQIHSGDRYRIMAGNDALQAQERLYLADPQAAMGDRAWTALQAVGETLALDFAGVDFAVLPDGRLCVYEANAAMRHNFDHAGAFPYTRPHLETISRAFTTMVAERAARPAR
jgi:hypothetical protein